jgi:hypothetical protein
MRAIRAGENFPYVFKGTPSARQAARPGQALSMDA